MYDRIYDKLCDILEDMERKDKLTASDMQIIDWATHSMKSMLAVEEMGGYSNTMKDGRSYARKRDSMGRYSREGRSYRYSRTGKDSFFDNMRAMMEDAPDEMTRQSIQRMLNQIEQD